MKSPVQRFYFCTALLVLPMACNRSGPSIPFASYSDKQDSKTDFARVEHEFPLKPDQLIKLTPANIKNYDQEQVDQIYARLTAGPIPDGASDGDLFFPKGSSGYVRAAEIAGGLKGLAIQLQAEKLKLLGEVLWKGKVFYRNERVLRNRMDHLELLQDFFPDKKAQIRELETNGRKDRLMFPAKLYCGQSLLDSRRESVIIDYAFTDQIEGYREVPDALAGRDGFVVRDEIRMVRPGFYLGRAYLYGSFGLNFTLYNDAVAKAKTDDFMKTANIEEDCWAGSQRLMAAK